MGNVGIILSSTEEKMRVFHNPFDLSAYSRSGHAHKSVLLTNSYRYGRCGVPMQFIWDLFFYNLDKFFTKSATHIRKTAGV